MAHHTPSIPTIALGLLQNMRPRQWTKNGFVFAAILFDQKLLDPVSLGHVLLAFVLLCLTASGIYIINDVVDADKDRHHPNKKHRPIASGRLPVPVALIAAGLFMLIAILGGYWLDFELSLVIVVYILVHIGYSFVFKNVVILDVFVIALGFILRLIAGVVVIDVARFSPWLYVCAGLLSLFLAIGKRRQELITMGDRASVTRSTLAQYSLELINDMLRLTITSTAVAYTLYAAGAETVLVQGKAMLLTVPFVYYALFRYLYVIYIKEHGGDPTEILFEDRPLQAVIALWGLLIVFLLYLM